MTSGGRVVVIGGSVAGLLAARVLAERAQEVVILERDELPEEPEFRGGCPQARHAHALLERGRQIIEGLLPGITQEMAAAGACTYDVCRDFAFLSWAGEAVRFESGVPWLAVSRPFLEHHVRRRVRALPNVRVRTGVRVSGLDGSAGKVTGVRVHGGDPIAADLVVDASGRESRAPEWLRGVDVTPPRETTVKPFLGYASRIYEPGPSDVWNRVAMIAIAMPPHLTRGASVVPIEGGRFIVTLIGMSGDYPPTDEGGFDAFARSVPVPEFHAWLAAARPVSDIHGFRFEQNRLRHFEDCVLPTGFLAVGDAVASFNPIYGQGMTTAAIGAEVLAGVLGREPIAPTLGPRFHRKLASALDAPWTATTTEDLRFPATEGKRSFGLRVAYAYLDRLFVLAARDAPTRKLLAEVFGMIKPSSHLFKLPLALRVLATSMPKDLARPQHVLRTRSTTA